MKFNLHTQNQDGTGKKLVAVLEKDGDKIVAKWLKGSVFLREYLENTGVRSREGRIVLGDGAKFLPAMERFFSTSTTVIVERV